MATTVSLNDDFVTTAKIYAKTSNRSLPKQIEHWVKIGRTAEDNPDLPYSFILETQQAKNELNNLGISRYVRRTQKSED